MTDSKADVAGRSLLLTASIGIALAPQDGTDLDQLIKNADLAMYAFYRGTPDAALQIARAQRPDLLLLAALPLATAVGMAAEVGEPDRCARERWRRRRG